MKNWPVIRDIILFFGGLSGVAYQTLASGVAEKPTLLLVYAAMMGLPVVLRKDEKNGN